MSAHEKASRSLFPPIVVAISLGSNLGDRRQYLENAVSALQIDLTDMVSSTFVETAPLGVGGEHGPYLNAVVVGRTRLSAHDLLGRLLEIEEEQGRVRPYPQAPRTLDLDLILYGDTVIQERDLIVPHPRFRERLFVLTPLAEIAADLIDPVTGKTIATLVEALLA